MTLVLVAGHWAERTDGRKNLFKRKKNLPVVILSFREQTLTNIIHDNHGKQPNLRFHVPLRGERQPALEVVPASVSLSCRSICAK